MLQVSDSEALLSKIQQDIEDAKQFYEDTIEKKVMERYDLYYAEPEYYKKKLPKLSRTSNLVSTDVADTIEWALPSIMKVFWGSDDIITIRGVTSEDDQQARVMQELIKYQLGRRNQAFVTFYNWFKDSLITGLGVIKCYWERETRDDVKTELLGVQQLQMLQSDPNIQITATEQVAADLYKVTTVTSHILKNQPKVENVMASELLFSPKARNLNEAPFVAHRKSVTLDYLRRRELEGLYIDIDKVAENLREPEETQLEEHLSDTQLKTQAVDDARKEVELFECYTQLDINDDGLLENIIVTLASDVIIRVEENGYGRHPFFVLSPMKDPHRIYPRKSYADLIGQLQDLKIALTRQIVTNTALSNDNRAVVSEEAINIEDFISGRAIIRKKPGYPMGDVIQALPVQPLAPWTFNFLEWVESQKENRTGITRYNQGLDARSLNKTATGISAIMQASNQRLEMVCRMFAETGVSELFRHLITLCQKFIDQETVIRITNEQLVIRPDDLQGDFDLEVNAGVGMGTKEMTMMNLQTLLTTVMQVMGSGMPVASPTNIYNILKKYIEELGFKNVQDYITDPQQQMMMQQMMGGLNGIPGQPPGGPGPGGESPNSQGIPPEILQQLQGMGNQPNQAPEINNGGLNPMQAYAPRG